MDDAFKVCSNTIPDRSRTIACMVANKSRLSAGCQGVMDKYASGGNTQTAAMSPCPHRHDRAGPHDDPGPHRRQCPPRQAAQHLDALRPGWPSS